ncbi:MAG: DUF3990 domain-containing protein [Planctomycetaceae bacterium]|nr:DUF3990 domain-containing protein [Planctomycetaceae bacterium]
MPHQFRLYYGYDIVIGKVTNNAVGETVNFAVCGVMRREYALKKLRFQQINNQICFATEKAPSFLQYTDCKERLINNVASFS